MAKMSRRDVDIHYDLFGEGIPLLLVHGLGETGQKWQELGYVDRLSPDFRMICPDMRGHGQSSKPQAPEAYQLDMFVADLVGLLDALSIEKVNYFGYSMGGRIGYSFLRYAPERLNAMIIGGASHLERPGHRIDIRDSSDLPVLHNAIEKFVGEPLSEDFLAGRSFDEIRAIAYTISARWPDLGAGLSNRGIPVQVFCGDQDSRFGRVQETVRCFSHVKLETFNGATHGNTLDDVERLSALIRRWIVDVIAGAG